MARATLSGVRIESIADRVEIAPGVSMPRLGLGTSRAVGEEAVRAIMAAFELGYRLVDTSANYDNEQDVGAAIAASAVPREDLFITTKLEGSDQVMRTVRSGLEGSLRRLGLDYVDLYLIHWPIPELTNETWAAMEELQRAGLVRALGVSNFERRDLEQLFATATIRPAVNQVKLNPAEQREDLYDYCVAAGITVEAWAPVMRGRTHHLRVLERIGHAHGKTSAQVSLRWLLQKGIVAIPKSVHRARLEENADLYDFELSDEEMTSIEAI